MSYPDESANRTASGGVCIAGQSSTFAAHCDVLHDWRLIEKHFDWRLARDEDLSENHRSRIRWEMWYCTKCRTIEERKVEL